MGQKKSIVVTGCCGTIGHALLTALARKPDCEAVLGVDNNESGLFALEQEFRGKFSFAYGDIRDRERLKALFSNYKEVIHTAALKHVAPCEMAPEEAIKTNILGVDNVINAARHAGMEKALFTSSDKAVNPTNVMGTSKLMGERLMSAAQASIRHTGAPVFFSTRFGNVLGSHGSVFPIFQRQIAAGGPVTITDPEMTRFVMSTHDAVDLVLGSMDHALGGEVFVPKMPALRIIDLAQAMISTLAPLHGFEPEQIKVEIIGRKPGEKLYEELLTEEESSRVLTLGDFYVILPAFRDFYEIEYDYPAASAHVGGVYRSGSQPLMTVPEIVCYLQKSGLVPARKGC